MSHDHGASCSNQQLFPARSYIYRRLKGHKLHNIWGTGFQISLILYMLWDINCCCMERLVNQCESGNFPPLLHQTWPMQVLQGTRNTPFLLEYVLVTNLTACHCTGSSGPFWFIAFCRKLRLIWKVSMFDCFYANHTILYNIVTDQDLSHLYFHHKYIFVISQCTNFRFHHIFMANSYD